LEGGGIAAIVFAEDVFVEKMSKAGSQFDPKVVPSEDDAAVVAGSSDETRPNAPARTVAQLAEITSVAIATTAKLAKISRKDFWLLNITRSSWEYSCVQMLPQADQIDNCSFAAVRAKWVFGLERRHNAVCFYETIELRNDCRGLYAIFADYTTGRRLREKVWSACRLYW
jgi:hypothetical protein